MDEKSATVSLAEVGLTAQQAALYGTLVRTGPLPASKLAREVGLSRPLCYKVLDELIELGLVEKDDKPGAVAKFSAAHPLKLKELADTRFAQAQNAKAALDGVLAKLVSDFNLQSGKPGIRFFEGREGIRECMNDALTSRTDIYSYVDIAAIEKHIPDVSRDFAKARQKLKLKKKNIGVDTPENRAEVEGYYPDVTEERLIPWPAEKFGTVMQIYDGKVSYFTVEAPMIGVIIADPHIYTMHRSLFEYVWNDPRAYIPARAQAAAGNDSEPDADSSTMSQVSTS
jgi:sugar-specific transcriptional regulator TrmB